MDGVVAHRQHIRGGVFFPLCPVVRSKLVTRSHFMPKNLQERQLQGFVLSIEQEEESHRYPYFFWASWIYIFSKKIHVVHLYTQESHTPNHAKTSLLVHWFFLPNWIRFTWAAFPSASCSGAKVRCPLPFCLTWTSILHGNQHQSRIPFLLYWESRVCIQTYTYEMRGQHSTLKQLR